MSPGRGNVLTLYCVRSYRGNTMSRVIPSPLPPPPALRLVAFCFALLPQPAFFPRQLPMLLQNQFDVVYKSVWNIFARARDVTQSQSLARK